MRYLMRCFDSLLFSHISPLIDLGSKKCLEAEDLPPFPKALDPRHLPVDAQQMDWTTGGRLLRSLIVTLRPYWLWPTLLYLLFAAMNLLGPVMINQFVTRLQTGRMAGSDLFWTLLCGLGVGLLGLVGGLALQHYFYHHLIRYGVVINLLNKKVFSKALSLSSSAKAKTPIGDLVNHLSVDSESVAEVPGAISDFFYCLVMMCGALGLMFYYLGSTSWVAILMLGLLLPLTKRVSRELTKFDEELMKFRDQRISLMSQVISAIRLIKFFAWEKSVEREVSSVRERELQARGRIARSELVVTLLYVSVGSFVLFVVLSVHAWRGGQFDAALVFTCISLFSLMEDPFAFLSRVISLLINAKVSAGRLSQYFQLAESSPEVSVEDPVRSVKSQRLGFELRDFSLRYENGHEAIRGMNLRVEPGESLAVIGPVGAGKSSLIQALLQEVHPTEGRLSFFNQEGLSTSLVDLAYVPQEAYILNGSLELNLRLGRQDLSREDLDEALWLADFSQDLAKMPQGLDTEIGEKGVTLSGGQRQRLSLARAFLHRPSLVILDDPLSAVDAATELRLADRLLFGAWKSTTRVVVTHRLSQLERFDRIIFLDQGKILSQGTFQELKESCKEFRDYLNHHLEVEHVGARESESTHGIPAESLTVASLLAQEDREYGSVKGKIFWDYLLTLGGIDGWRPIRLFFLLALAAAGTFLPLIQKAWLAWMSDARTQVVPESEYTWWDLWLRSDLNSLGTYGLIGLVVTAGILVADLYWLKRGLEAGRWLHDRMLRSVLGARIGFFDSTPVGRILQRFSRDVEAVDIHLQWSFEHAVKSFAQVVVTLTLIVSLLPAVLLFIIPIGWLYHRLQLLYRKSAREVKRLDSLSRSPRFAHFKETLQGLVVLRAFKQQNWFMEEFYQKLAHSQRMWFGHILINRWFSARIPVLGGAVAILTNCGIVLAVQRGGLSPGVAGLLSLYSMSFWGVLNWGVRIWAEVEARMTSMERVLFYSRLDQEEELQNLQPLADWPKGGEIMFENVSVRYRDDLPLVLEDLSFCIRPGEKVGVLGRTGSGKSTLLQCLFRFVNPCVGRILIDGVDIQRVPLEQLRRAIAIIPQDPTLFMGSLRSNLDRYGEFSEAELWRVLELTHMRDFVQDHPQRLDMVLQEGGVNLSQGQRQLLCLARALLLDASVIVLDEATASVDVQTDAKIQQVLREACREKTMLVVAHRLGTIRDCDFSLHLSAGKLQSNWSREQGFYQVSREWMSQPSGV